MEIAASGDDASDNSPETAPPAYLSCHMGSTASPRETECKSSELKTETM
jgi:hypothetical protein